MDETNNTLFKWLKTNNFWQLMKDLKISLHLNVKSERKVFLDELFYKDKDKFRLMDFVHDLNLKVN